MPQPKSTRALSLNPFRLWAALLLALMGLAGCGVIMDMAEDNEWRWGIFGQHEFSSQLKLKVGVLPFTDEVGLGAPEAGFNMADLLSQQLAQDERLIVLPPAAMAEALSARGYSGLLTPQQAAEIGTLLNLNAVVIGSITELKKYKLRKGWRRAARLLTSQRDYVDAVLAVSAVDSQTGIVLVSRANEGQYESPQPEPDFFEAGGLRNDIPSQEAIEASFDSALIEAAHRTLGGLASLPFKTMALSSWAGEVSVASGAELGLEPGQRFVKRELTETVTNTIGETYQVMGAVVADLEVVEVGEVISTLKIINGYVSAGDILEAAPEL